MENLTELETAVLAMILDGDHPVLRQLREQLASCHVKRREFTGVGFYTHLDVGDARPSGATPLRFGDVTAEIEGMACGAGFLLFVEHGRLCMLEGYSFDEPWPSTVDKYRLKYMGGAGRDWAAMQKALRSSGDRVS